MKIKLAALLLLFCYVNLSFSHNKITDVSIKTTNPSAEIDDGRAEILHVEGSTAPYTYQWSTPNTPLKSRENNNLREGSTYYVIVRDTLGNTFKKTFQIHPNGIGEHINALFSKIVSGLTSFFMFDPFYAVGLYNNQIKDKAGTIITHPNGTPRIITIPIIVFWLFIGGIFFTLYTKFINVRGFKHAIQLVKGVYDDPNAKGEVTHFQALTASLSGTVGLGNIAGVAVAISAGGPGATFWMIVCGFLGMSVKFVECTLGVKYRMFDRYGNIHGGPMYYLKDGLAKLKKARLGKMLAMSFALFCVFGSFGGGNMFQSNQAFKQVANTIPLLKNYSLEFGIIFAILVGLVIIGGIKSIGRVTSKLVPAMVILYITCILVVIIFNIEHIGDAFKEIFVGAFTPQAAKGGMIGVFIMGVRRAVFSNEAGTGTSSIAHAAVKTGQPVTEGFVATIGPFIDTVIICTMTALAIIFSGLHHGTSLGGVELTSAALTSVSSWFIYPLTLAVILFAFSTITSWSYYGLRAFTFIFGKDKSLIYIYKILTLIFIIVGAVSNTGAIIDFSDYMILALSIPNLIGLYLLSPQIIKDTKDYLDRLKRK